MSTLTRYQIVVLAKEVLAGKARSYVSAAHALAQHIVDAEAETRILVGDASTARHPAPTLPLPFDDPSPPESPCPIADALDSEAVAPWDAAARRILEPKTTLHLAPEPETGVRDTLPATSVDRGVVPCEPHGVVKCVVCNRGGAA